MTAPTTPRSLRHGGGKRPPPRAGSETRQRLLDAAERLFAEYGIEAISLRAVNAAAGARNTGAAHYHFGTRDGLVRAVVTRRLDALSRERIGGLRAIEAAARGGPPDLRALVEATLAPNIRLLADPAGSHYVSLLARIVAEPRIDLNDLVTPAFQEASSLFFTLLGRALPTLTPPVLIHRAIFMSELLTQAVAFAARTAQRNGAPFSPAYLEVFTRHLVDFVAGGLAAADSAEAPREEVTPAATSSPAPRASTGGRAGAAPWGLAGPPPPVRRKGRRRRRP